MNNRNTYLLHPKLDFCFYILCSVSSACLKITPPFGNAAEICIRLKIVANYFSSDNNLTLGLEKATNLTKILNMSDKGYPLEQDSPPLQQEPPPQQGNQGNFLPQQGYPVPQVYLPPQEGYPPQQGYPPQTGYPPQQGYPPQTGYPPQQVPMAPMVIRDSQTPANDYLIFAILVTICCLPLGIVAIVKALEVRSLNDRGDYTSAQQASQKAKSLSVGTLFCGILIVTIICVYYALMRVSYFARYRYY
ncbi:Proline-rich transmembrane protein 1 [Holothuria leucospilota]|uniref:Proline-rich transmembrane protein 1 n=1 Tax=Holothuria leucospilota TaxID=206669 RepID=A0A9Q1BNI0_HOLLE|nr:Proline-rich transmembrane protein 1 [Holothuria leucospilota]